MNNEEIKEVLEIVGDAHNSLMQYLEEELPEIGVRWSDEAYIAYEPKKDAFYVSVTEGDDDKYDRWLPWNKFIDMTKNSDPDVIEGLIQKFESGIKELKAHQRRFEE